MRILPVLLAAWFCLALALAAQEGDAAPPRGVNDTCPVMEGEPVGDKPVVIEYQGKLINLCCKKCKRLFFEEPAKYLALLPQFAAPVIVPVVSPVVTVPPMGGGAAATVAAVTAKPEQLPFLEWLGRFHVVLVHFPVALAIFACWLEWFALVRRKSGPHPAAMPLLAGAATSAALAIALGLLREESLEFTGARHSVLETHEAWAWTALCAMLVALICLRRAGGSVLWRRLYLATLTLAAIAVAVAGHAGGRLTQGIGFFSRG